MYGKKTIISSLFILFFIITNFLSSSISAQSPTPTPTPAIKTRGGTFCCDSNAEDRCAELLVSRYASQGEIPEGAMCMSEIVETAGSASWNRQITIPGTGSMSLFDYYFLRADNPSVSCDSICGFNIAEFFYWKGRQLRNDGASLFCNEPSDCHIPGHHTEPGIFGPGTLCIDDPSPSSSGGICAPGELNYEAMVEKYGTPWITCYEAIAEGVYGSLEECQQVRYPVPISDSFDQCDPQRCDCDSIIFIEEFPSHDPLTRRDCQFSKCEGYWYSPGGGPFEAYTCSPSTEESCRVPCQVDYTQAGHQAVIGNFCMEEGNYLLKVTGRDGTLVADDLLLTTFQTIPFSIPATDYSFEIDTVTPPDDVEGIFIEIYSADDELVCFSSNIKSAELLDIINEPEYRGFEMCKQIPNWQNINEQLYQECMCCAGHPDHCATVGKPTPRIGGVWSAVGCLSYEPKRFVEQIVFLGLTLSGGILLLILLSGAFLITTGRGDPQQMTKAKEMITSAIIGTLMIVFSVVILRFIASDLLRIPGFGE